MYSYYKPDAYPDLALRRQPVRGLGSNLLRFECVVWLRKCVGWFGFVVWFKCLVSSVLFWIWMCCCECVAWFEHVPLSVLFDLVALFQDKLPKERVFSAQRHDTTTLLRGFWRHYSIYEACQFFGRTPHICQRNHRWYFSDRFDIAGIYVVMFLHILKTLIQVILVFSFLIVAFGFAFYLLMENEVSSQIRLCDAIKPT